MRVSIIVNNYNYDRYVGPAIASALDQTHAQTQVVVVDDGSTDASRRVIDGFGDRVTRVYKANGGQASALNRGFAAADGDAVIFLDADDVLLPDAAATVAQTLYGDPGLSKVAWPMLEIDAAGRATARRHPERRLDRGDCRRALADRGPFNICTPPTSGNGFPRRVLERLLPIPERRFRTCADGYLLLLAPLYGSIAALEEPLSCYRVHGANALSGTSEFQRVARLWENNLVYRELLAQRLVELGLTFEINAWQTRDAYLERVLRMSQLIEREVAPGEAFVLVDADRLNVGRQFGERRRRYFVDADCGDGGPPADDAPIVSLLDGHVAAGATALLITQDCLWWLDHYPALREYLGRKARRIEDDLVAAWRLAGAAGGTR